MSPTLLALVLVLTAIPPSTTESPAVASTGQTVLTVWPSERADGLAGDPAGYTLFLSPADDPEGELLLPAGIPHVLPRGDYWAFVESSDRISLSPSLLTVAPTAKDEGTSAVSAVGEAGRVRIDSPFAPSGDLVAQLIHLESHRRKGGELHEGFSRRLPLDAPAPAVLLPTGKALAAVYSRRAGAFLALSRPFVVAAEREALATPKPPAADAADLLLIFERSPPARSVAEDELAASLSIPGGKQRPADLLIPTASRFYAVWYGLPAGPARLLVRSPSLFLADRLLELRPGEVTSEVLRLGRQTSLKVGFDLPENLRQAARLELQLVALRPAAFFDSRPVARNARELLLEKLPPALFTLSLRSGPWSFDQEVDLRDGNAGELRFAPLETALSGTLRRGGKALAGEISFRPADQKNAHRVATDGEGGYATSLWRAGTYEVVVESPQLALPYRQLVEIAEVPEKLLDFDIPTARYQVRAIDGRSQKALGLRSADFELEDDDGHLLKGRLEVVAGKAILPPLPPGKLRLELAAEGYRNRVFEGLELAANGPDAEIVADFEKVEGYVTLQLLQGLSEKVEGAEVRVLHDVIFGDKAWEGRSDGDGLVQIPAVFAGLPLLIRHPHTAFHADLVPPPSVAPIEVRLAARPSPDKAVVLVTGEDRQPIPGAEVALGIGPVWLRGDSLVWLVSALRGPFTNGHGLFLMFGAPPENISLLARHKPFEADELGHLSALATRLDADNKGPVVIRALPD